MQISAIVHLILQLMKYLFSSTNICFWDYRLQEGKVDCSKQLYFSVGGRSRFSMQKGILISAYINGVGFYGI